MEKQLLSSQSNNNNLDAATITNWMLTYMAELLEMERESINPDTGFDRYGLDSSAMIVLSGDLETWLGCKLEPEILYEYPTINALSNYLAGSLLD